MRTTTASKHPPTIPLLQLISHHRNDCRMLEAYGQFGPISRTSFVYPQYFINDPASIFHVLCGNATNYDKDRVAIARLAKMIGPGLISHTHDRWKASKQYLGHPFKAENLDHLSTPIQNIVQNHSHQWPRNQSQDILSQCLALALDINVFCLTGQHIGKHSHHLSEQITKAVAHGCRALSLSAGWPSLHKWRFQQLAKPLHAWADQLLRALLDDPHASQTLLGPLVQAYQQHDIDWEILAGEFKTLLFAGYEATGTSLAWLLYHLAENPKAKHKVQQEIRDVYPDPSGPIDRTQLNDSPYTSLAIAESLRLSPPIFVMERRSKEPDTLCGYHIPADSLLIISPYTIQRHPQYWPEPNRFYPERFQHTAPSKSLKGSYLPYGLGPRSCIGMSLAKMILKIATITITQTMDWTSSQPQPVMGTGQITLKPKNGIWVEMRKTSSCV